ncbi:hypothetical protein H7169_02985 [Candidatus Gracilibacteria bacterium]|nr:hypothetical protein [Candidatus Gracilibacteria bacterium]
MRTNTNKLISGALLASMMLVSGVSAATIGTGTVVGSGALTSSVVWNDTFPGTATGTINGLVIKARIQPTLNMTITGSGVIDLGLLTPAGYSSGSVNIEIGTNAANGASVTAKSTNGGLKNVSDATQFINSLATDGAVDSYKFASAIVAATDSTIGGFVQTAALNTEVNNTTTSHVIYTSNKPQALSGPTDDFSFTVSAQPNAQSPAGDYNDVVIVTVTGNF